MTNARFIGIDIAKAKVDVAEAGMDRVTTYPNDVEGQRRVVAWIVDGGVVAETLVVIEATGGLERPLIEQLLLAGVQVAKVNPKRVRDYARAMGKLAKTDKIDALVIAAYGKAIEPTAHPIKDQQQQELSALISRRRALVDTVANEKKRRGTALARIRPSIDNHLAWLADAIDAIEAEIDQMTDDNTQWREKRRRLQTIPGVGKIVSAVMVSEMPELGQLNNKQAAALVGTAPFNKDSGNMRGRRVIYGGRATARSALYMAAVTATRWNPPIRDFYLRLIAKGKPFKVAITACMRKLIVYMNAMLRDQVDWQPPISADLP